MHFVHEFVDEVLNERLYASDGFWREERGEHAFVCYGLLGIQGTEEMCTGTQAGVIVATGVFMEFGADFEDPNFRQRSFICLQV